MAGPDWQGDVAVFAFDVVGYSPQRPREQLAIRQLTDRLRDEAVRAAGVSIEGRKAWSDAGDGGYLSISGDPRQALRVLEHFVRELEAENERRLPNHRVALRYALHYGSVSISGEVEPRLVIGNAINDCERLLAGMRKNLLGQVVASATFVDKVEAFGPVGVRFEPLQPIVDKHGNEHSVFNVRKDPGFGIEVPPEDHLDPR